MDETRKTLIFVIAAVVLAAIAFIMTPHRITPDAFLDQGQPFFPEFTDPNAAATLEVVAYDEASGAAKPFKVVNNNGVWTIPSHYNYPADGQDRLAKTAAGVIGIKKDDFRTDNVADHEKLGVIDPLDQKAGLSGRGQRVTLNDKDSKVLADFIIGHQVEGRQGFRFVRVPDQKRVYAVRMNIDISTRFQDWIQADLMQIGNAQVNQVALKDYSINERTMSVEQRDNLVLELKDQKWTARGTGSGQMVDSTKMATLVRTLKGLTIVGVRPKPKGMSENLKRNEGGHTITTEDVLSLQNKGFYFSRDGQLLSNEGELQFTTSEGVTYTLRFGELLYGTGEAVSSGAATEGSERQGPAESRYLFITAAFDENAVQRPAKPANTDFQGKADSLLTDADRQNKAAQATYDKGQRDVDKGRTLAEKMNRRFADWYYVISADSFDKLHLGRRDLVVPKS
jgi:hypothetical protein